MFEDIDDQNAVSKSIAVTRDAGDRALVYAIWTRNAGGGTSRAEDAWSLIHERYPEDARFLLLHTYEELIATSRSAVWTPTEFLAKVRRVLDAAGGRLNPEVRDLLAVAEDDLHPLTEEDAARLDRIRTRVSSRTGDPTAARKRFKTE